MAALEEGPAEDRVAPYNQKESSDAQYLHPMVDESQGQGTMSKGSITS